MIQAQEGLDPSSGGQEESEVRDKGTVAMSSGKEDVKSEREKQLPQDDDSVSDSESGAESDDEASSTSDFPSLFGSTGMTGPSKTGQTSLAGLEARGDQCCGVMVEQIGQLDISKGISPQGASAVPPCSLNLSSVEGASAVCPPELTLQLPVHAGGSSGEESNGGNEPDISASVSESEGNPPLENLPHHHDDALLQQLPKRTGPAAGDHGNGRGSENESGDSSSEEEEDGRGEDGLEELSRQNKLHRPHRDKSGGGGQDDQSDSLSVTTTLSTTNSYLYGENAGDRVRHLVKRNISKKRKQQQRQGRPKKETKAPTAAGRRAKKTNRNVIKQSMDGSIF